MSTTLNDSYAYSVGKNVRSKLLSIKFILNITILKLEAEFVNPKLLTNVPGPGHVDPLDKYTTKEKVPSEWSINRNEKNKKPRPIRQPGP